MKHSKKPRNRTKMDFKQDFTNKFIVMVYLKSLSVVYSASLHVSHSFWFPLMLLLLLWMKANGSLETHLWDQKEEGKCVSSWRSEECKSKRFSCFASRFVSYVRTLLSWFTSLSFTVSRWKVWQIFHSSYVLCSNWNGKLHVFPSFLSFHWTRSYNKSPRFAFTRNGKLI